MKSAVETLSPTRVKLTVEVPFEELKPALDGAYKRIAAQVTDPGVPQGQGARLASSTSASAAPPCSTRRSTSACRSHLDAAIARARVRPLGQPEVDVTRVQRRRAA